MSIKLIVLIILVSLAVIFLTQNVAAVEVTFLLWSISMSRALLIFFTLVIGFALGWFYIVTCLIEKRRLNPLILNTLNNYNKEAYSWQNRIFVYMNVYLHWLRISGGHGIQR
jgi:uncharacterized integral membrane protein